MICEDVTQSEGKRRAVIIVPELSFNSGWSGIAEKIGRFIHSYKRVGNLETHRLVDSNIPYVDMLKSSKWTNKGRMDMPKNIIKRGGGGICINGDANRQSEVLKKSLVGKFMTSKGKAPTLTEVTAEQVVEGEWVWRNLPVKMQWWSPTGGGFAVTLLGAPHLQSYWGLLWGVDRNRRRNPQLQNHLKWARIKIKGNGSDVPKEVTIDDGAFLYTMQVWTEAPEKVTIGENNIQSSSEKVFVEDSIVLRGAADKVVQPRAMAETCGENFRTPNVDLGLRTWALGFFGSKSLNATLGQLGQFSPNSSGKNKEVAHDGHMTSMNEIKILASQFLEALSHWESPSKLPQGEISMEKGPTPMKTQGEKSDIHQETASQNMIDESGAMKLQEKGDCSMETDVVASNIPRKTNGEEIEASNWINSHILELSSTYGVAFEGFREETLALLMRLDERKFALENKMIEGTSTTPSIGGLGKMN
ncbi:hypothetical protein H5410_030440 [Solanum commersonii]|uniref:DUF4283 domain-containing protein n=1 Tax=Solanum commersonii TaxID=4109 RepID=A0A9J5YJC6_SOLCO|nr:hypothetical protein H5410_030440 [Solanum commersonii]